MEHKRSQNATSKNVGSQLPSFQKTKAPEFLASTSKRQRMEEGSLISRLGNTEEEMKKEEEDDFQRVINTTSQPLRPAAALPLKNWEYENSIEATTSFFKFDPAEQNELMEMKPWTVDPLYFKFVKLSAIALLKMTMHAKRGGNLEIMGLLQGRIDSNTFIILDVFALPVEGTETTVNAQAQAYEYMTVYSQLFEAEGRQEKVVGWYHSHPGYGCWLSGIDVSTQSLNQEFQEPWVAIVIDPLRTMSAGKVDIGAFRTYPDMFVVPDNVVSEYQPVPFEKVEDCGSQKTKYYSLPTSIFKSHLDTQVLESLWSKHWYLSLASSRLFSNMDFVNNQVANINEKLAAVEKSKLSHDSTLNVQEVLDQAGIDSKTVAKYMEDGRIAHIVKRMIFDRQTAGCCIERSQRSDDNDEFFDTESSAPFVGRTNGSNGTPNGAANGKLKKKKTPPASAPPPTSATSSKSSSSSQQKSAISNDRERSKDSDDFGTFDMEDI